MQTTASISTEKISIKKVPYSKVPQLSKRDISYISEDSNLRPFYKYAPRLESFKQVIEDKSKASFERATLVSVLKNQYKNLDLNNKVGKNIDLLSQKNTFTVITAHQPSLFTGPLYYVLKIFSTINLAEQLNRNYPESNIVPVFITGGEDHDFEEVNHTEIFGKKIQWESGETGSVGMMKTDKLPLEELKSILGNSEKAQEIFSIFEKAYTSNDKYSDGVIQMVHELFAEYGLVVLNMNQPKLKAQFKAIAEEEIIKQSSFGLVNKTIEKLNAVGLNAQASPREINFFYLKDQMRERIVFEDGKYAVLNSNLSFTEKAIKEEIQNHPERFSPNVILRPLYQEIVLPNLAYIGGGGEIAYWLERREQFEHYGINFPMLIRRNSAMWVDKNSAKKMQKVGLDETSIFSETDSLLKAFVQSNSEAELSLKEEKKELTTLFEAILAKAKKIDPSLKKSVEGEKTKQLKAISNLEGKLLRAEKNNHDVSLNQIRGLKEKLFAGNGLQERKENFLGIYLKHGREFFDILKENLNPLDKNFVVFVEKK